jgi:molecular chaperone GrpE
MSLDTELEKDPQTTDTGTENVGEKIPAEGTDEIELLKAQIIELQEKHLRLYAEFDNYKRRTAKERIDIVKTAGQEVITDLLPVLDDFERAERSVVEDLDIEVFAQGYALIKEKFFRILQTKGLKAMESKGQPFDADLHEAITEVPAPSKEWKGKVVDEVEKGYLLNDKIIRYAKVVVGK